MRQLGSHRGVVVSINRERITGGQICHDQGIKPPSASLRSFPWHDLHTKAERLHFRQMNLLASTEVTDIGYVVPPGQMLKQVEDTNLTSCVSWEKDLLVKK